MMSHVAFFVISQHWLLNELWALLNDSAHANAVQLWTSKWRGQKRSWLIEYWKWRCEMIEYELFMLIPEPCNILQRNSKIPSDSGKYSGFNLSFVWISFHSGKPFRYFEMWLCSLSGSSVAGIRFENSLNINSGFYPSHT